MRRLLTVTATLALFAGPLAASASAAQLPRDTAPHKLTQSTNLVGATATYRIDFGVSTPLQQSTTDPTNPGSFLAVDFGEATLPANPADYTFDGAPVTQLGDQGGETDVALVYVPVNGHTDGTDDTLVITNVVNPTAAGSHQGAIQTSNDTAPTMFNYAVANAGDATTTPADPGAPTAPVATSGSGSQGTTTIHVPAPGLKLNHSKAIYGTLVTARVDNLKPGSTVRLVQSGGGHRYVKGTGRADSQGVATIRFHPSVDKTFTWKLTATGTNAAGSKATPSTHLKVLRRG